VIIFIAVEGNLFVEVFIVSAYEVAYFHTFSITNVGLHRVYTL